MNKSQLEKLQKLRNPQADLWDKLLAQITQLKGDDGYTPKKGIDYFTAAEIDSIIKHIRSQVPDGYTPVKGKDYRDGIDGYTPVKGKDYRDGVDGFTPVRGVDYYTKKDKEDLLREVLSQIPKPKPLLALTEKGVQQQIDAAFASRKIKLGDIEDVNKLVDFLKLGGFRGGGLTNITGYISAGTNVTITGTGTASDPYVINSSGGGTVSSVFGRIGAVVAVSGDYDTSLVPDTADKRYVTDAQLVVIGNTSGVNTGDQTSIVGITGTKAQFDAAVTDGNFLYVGDITQYTDEMAQDAIGAMIDSSLVYVDGTPLLQRAALTGDVTASAGSNSLTIANDAVTFAKMQNSSAASVLLGRGAGSGAGDFQEITLGSGLTMTGTTLSASGGGGGTPGGTNKQIQFNDSGSFGGMVLEYSLSGINPTLTIPDQTTANTDGPNLTIQGARGKGTGTGSTITLNGGNDELDVNYGAIVYIGGGVTSGVGGGLSFSAGQGEFTGGSIAFTAGNASDVTGIGGDLLFGAGTGPAGPGNFGIIQPGTTNKAYFNVNPLITDRTFVLPDVSGHVATISSPTSINNNIFFGTTTEGELNSNGIFKFVLASAELRVGNYLGAANGSITGGVLGASKGISIVEDIADYNAATYTKSYATIKTDANIASIDLWAANGAGGSMTIESTNGGSAILMNGTAGSITLSTDSNTLFMNNGLFGISNNGATRTGYFDMGALTGAASRTFAFPDADGTVALTANPTDITVPTEAYGAGWSGSAEVPTKGDLYTKIQSMGGGSGITRSVNSISMDTSAGATALTDYVYFCTAGLTLTLPTGAGNTNTYTITRTGTATVYVTTTGGELIYGSNTVSGDSTLEMVDRYSQLTLYSDGSNWYY